MIIEGPIGMRRPSRVTEGRGKAPPPINREGADVADGRIENQQIETVRAAALLHDIGKIDIGREILYKAAQLTEEERETMKKHVEMGADILNLAEAPLGKIIPIILAHHDKYDGSGYHPTSGKNIPIEAKVLSVADVYDALRTKRVYKDAMSHDKAKKIIIDQVS